MGLVSPVPDWVSLFRAADKMNTDPRTLTDIEVPKRVWVMWALTLATADNLVQEAKNEENERETEKRRKAIGSR